MNRFIIALLFLFFQPRSFAGTTANGLRCEVEVKLNNGTGSSDPKQTLTNTITFNFQEKNHQEQLTALSGKLAYLVKVEESNKSSAEASYFLMFYLLKNSNNVYSAEYYAELSGTAQKDSPLGVKTTNPRVLDIISQNSHLIYDFPADEQEKNLSDLLQKADSSGQYKFGDWASASISCTKN